MKLAYSSEELKKTANDIRINIVESIHCGGSGHPGGSLSIAEMMAVLYFHEMDVDEKNPKWEDRDRFVLSKGHAAPAYYAALAERGYFDKEVLKTLRHIDSILQGHPDMKKVPGVDMSTGSLGQGISAAAGMARFAKQTGKGFRVYSILGDGEIQEGQVWEAVMSAGHFKLDNLTAFLDNNDLQIDGRVGEVSSPYPIDEKFRAFGFEVFCCDGHDFAALEETFQKVLKVTGKPAAIIAKTIKGKGVSYMEDQVGWHGKAPNDEEYAQAMQELRAKMAELEAQA